MPSATTAVVPVPTSASAQGRWIADAVGQSPAFVTSSLPIATEDLVWIAIGAFVFALGLQWVGQIAYARFTAAGAWAVFGLFWLDMVPYFYGEVQSPLETLLSLAAVPLCLYTGYLLAQGRDSLLVLSKAVAFMGLIYLPVETIPIVQTWLIETTAAQANVGMELLGYSPDLVEGENGYLSKLYFPPEETVTGRSTYIILACTGIGSMAIFGGLIASVRAPLGRKLAALAASIGIIWFLNLLRNVFIGLASPWGWFQFEPVISITTALMGVPEDQVSFIVAHHFIAQTLAILALLGITYLVVRVLPEILEPLEEALFVLTGTEYDLFEAVGREDVRADGGPEETATANRADD
ncbi:archaeosortase A [Natrialbaceae archaeon GCM10025810]|uniref:archaeosortase A n=1 Tax=Halovalidus salilacus TaxID=3075124 RepID=UPI003615533E